MKGRERKKELEKGKWEWEEDKERKREDRGIRRNKGIGGNEKRNLQKAEKKNLE